MFSKVGMAFRYFSLSLYSADVMMMAGSSLAKINGKVVVLGRLSHGLICTPSSRLCM